MNKTLKGTAGLAGIIMLMASTVGATPPQDNQDLKENQYVVFCINLDCSGARGLCTVVSCNPPPVPSVRCDVGLVDGPSCNSHNDGTSNRLRIYTDTLIVPNFINYSVINILEEPVAAVVIPCCLPPLPPLAGMYYCGVHESFYDNVYDYTNSGPTTHTDPPEQSNVILGSNYNDLIRAGDGDDCVEGGPGDDTLNGEAGNDRLYGGPGDDLIYGGPGNDSIFGEEGDDVAAGNDYDNHPGHPQCEEKIDPNSSDVNYIYGGDGNDVIFGCTGYDHIRGGAGNDEILGFGGNDLLRGGDGSDIIWAGHWGSSHFATSATDTPTLLGEGGADFLYGENGKSRLVGGAGNDQLQGGSGDEKLSGGSGDDILYGGPGNDYLVGGSGYDIISGESGYDEGHDFGYYDGECDETVEVAVNC